MDTSNLVIPARRPKTGIGPLPPSELRTATFPVLDTAASHLENLVAQAREAHTALDAALSARRRAEAQDIEAAAAALRAGENDPGNPSVTAAEKAVADQRRRVAVLEAAVEAARSDLGDVIDQHRQAWIHAVDHKVEKQRARVRKIVESWAEERWGLRELESLRIWLRQGPESRYKAPRTLRIGRTIDSMLADLLKDVQATASVEEGEAA